MPGSGIELPQGPFWVLAVDKDATYLKYLHHTLDSFGYQVTICRDQAHAELLIRDKRDGFDVVIANIDKPYFDDELMFINFAHRNWELILTAMLNGSWDIFSKPMEAKKLQFIWRYIIRNRFVFIPAKLAGVSKRIHEEKSFLETSYDEPSSKETSKSIYSEATVEFDGRLVTTAENQRVKGMMDIIPTMPI